MNVAAFMVLFRRTPTALRLGTAAERSSGVGASAQLGAVGPVHLRWYDARKKTNGNGFVDLGIMRFGKGVLAADLRDNDVIRRSDLHVVSCVGFVSTSSKSWS